MESGGGRLFSIRVGCVAATARVVWTARAWFEVMLRRTNVASAMLTPKQTAPGIAKRYGVGKPSSMLVMFVVVMARRARDATAWPTVTSKTIRVGSAVATAAAALTVLTLPTGTQSETIVAIVMPIQKLIASRIAETHGVGQQRKMSVASATETAKAVWTALVSRVENPRRISAACAAAMAPAACRNRLLLLLLLLLPLLETTSLC